MLRQEKAFETNWVVFTGSPSAGKTTIIDKLKVLGYCTKLEVVREYIKNDLKDMSGSELEINLRSKETHQEILSRRMSLESKLLTQEPVILDRSVIDSFAYHELNGHDVKEAKVFAGQHTSQYRYKHVFLFNKLPLAKDGIRHESEVERNKLDVLFLKYYIEQGYQPIVVPVMSIEDRTAFVLKKMGLCDDKVAVPQAKLQGAAVASTVAVMPNSTANTQQASSPHSLFHSCQSASAAKTVSCESIVSNKTKS